MDDSVCPPHNGRVGRPKAPGAFPPTVKPSIPPVAGSTRPTPNAPPTTANRLQHTSSASPWELPWSRGAEMLHESSREAGLVIAQLMAEGAERLFCRGSVAIGPHLDATGIRLAGEERGFADLSVGTREQIAILPRISIAEALGAFVILDDQLTQSDGGRLAWLRDLLGEAARRIQVVVMTCHPEDYKEAPGAHVVDLTHCIRRSAPPA